MKFLILLIATVFTTYHKGVYTTVGDVDVTCSQAEMNLVIDSLMADFQHDPSHLFAWAFYGTGQTQDKRKTGFVIHYDSVYYDVPGELLTMNVTVFSPRGKADPMTVTCLLQDSRRPKGVGPSGPTGPGYTAERTIVFEVNYPGNLVKSCGAKLTFTPSASADPKAVGTQHLHLETHCKFGWFFNLFISRKMYRNTVEWRMQQFLENLRCTAEHKPLRSINVELVETDEGE